MGYSTSPGYIGPDETWRRFMAGMTVTYENALEDESMWVIRPMTRYHADHLAAMIGHPSTPEAAPAVSG